MELQPIESSIVSSPMKNDPFDSKDPLWDLLAKAKEPRPSPRFVADVMRLSRQTPQERGWLMQLWTSLSGHLGGPDLRPIMTAAAVLMVGGLGAWMAGGSAVAPSATPEFAYLDSLVDPLASLDHMDTLLAINDASLLTDEELAVFLD
jgi:hypothetical protein